MQRLERSQIVALTVALLLMVPLSGLAARWQWSRYEERDARNLLISTNANAQPINAEDLLIAGKKPSLDDEWTIVKLTGTYNESDQKLWRRQPLNGAPGFIAITPLITESGLRVLVQRGWVAALGRDPVPDTDLTVEPGFHTVTGRVRFIAAGESIDPSDLPNGVTNSPMTMLDKSTPLVTIEMTDDDRDFALTLIPLPELTSGPHLGYVGQWILIGIGTISVYIIVLRRSRDQTLLERKIASDASV